MVNALDLASKRRVKNQSKPTSSESLRKAKTKFIFATTGQAPRLLDDEIPQTIYLCKDFGVRREISNQVDLCLLVNLKIERKIF